MTNVDKSRAHADRYNRQHRYYPSTATARNLTRIRKVPHSASLKGDSKREIALFFRSYFASNTSTRCSISSSRFFIDTPCGAEKPPNPPEAGTTR